MPGCALCEMLAVTATHSVSAVTLLGDASLPPKKKKKKQKKRKRKNNNPGGPNATLVPYLNPALAGVEAGEMDANQFPVLSAPGDASPAGVSFVPNCSLFPPSSLPLVVSHPGDSKDVSWGAGPLSRGKRETWSRCQHFVNSPAFERDRLPMAGGRWDVAGREKGEV